MIRVLVCGGRGFTDAALLKEALDAIHASHQIGVLIHGAARGADSLADLWAMRNNITVERYPANWRQLGAAAGPMRNTEMLAKGYPDFVVAFPGGRGTANMIEQANRRGVSVLKFHRNEEGSIAYRCVA